MALAPLNPLLAGLLGASEVVGQGVQAYGQGVRDYRSGQQQDFQDALAMNDVDLATSAYENAHKGDPLTGVMQGLFGVKEAGPDPKVRAAIKRYVAARQHELDVAALKAKQEEAVFGQEHGTFWSPPAATSTPTQAASTPQALGALNALGANPVVAPSPVLPSAAPRSIVQSGATRVMGAPGANPRVAGLPGSRPPAAPLAAGNTWGRTPNQQGIDQNLAALWSSVDRASSTSPSAAPPNVTTPEAKPSLDIPDTGLTGNAATTGGIAPPPAPPNPPLGPKSFPRDVNPIWVNAGSNKPDPVAPILTPTVLAKLTARNPANAGLAPMTKTLVGQGQQALVAPAPHPSATSAPAATVPLDKLTADQIHRLPVDQASTYQKLLQMYRPAGKWAFPPAMTSRPALQVPAATPAPAAGGSVSPSQGQQPAAQPTYALPGAWPGMVAPGNIDLMTRPVVHNKDGTISTVKSFSQEIDGKEYLIPMVVDGKVVSEKDALNHFWATGGPASGQHLGVFKDAESADAYAEKLHQQQATVAGQPGGPSVTEPVATPDATSGFAGGQQAAPVTATDAQTPVPDPTQPPPGAIPMGDGSYFVPAASQNSYLDGVLTKAGIPESESARWPLEQKMAMVKLLEAKGERDDIEHATIATQVDKDRLSGLLSNPVLTAKQVAEFQKEIDAAQNHGDLAQIRGDINKSLGSSAAFAGQGSTAATAALNREERKQEALRRYDIERKRLRSEDARAASARKNALTIAYARIKTEREEGAANRGVRTRGQDQTYSVAMARLDLAKSKLKKLDGDLTTANKDLTNAQDEYRLVLRKNGPDDQMTVRASASVDAALAKRDDLDRKLSDAIDAASTDAPKPVNAPVKPAAHGLDPAKYR